MKKLLYLLLLVFVAYACGKDEGLHNNGDNSHGQGGPGTGGGGGDDGDPIKKSKIARVEIEFSEEYYDGVMSLIMYGTMKGNITPNASFVIIEPKEIQWSEIFDTKGMKYYIFTSTDSLIRKMTIESEKPVESVKYTMSAHKAYQDSDPRVIKVTGKIYGDNSLADTQEEEFKEIEGLPGSYHLLIQSEAEFYEGKKLDSSKQNLLAGKLLLSSIENTKSNTD